MNASYHVLPSTASLHNKLRLRNSFCSDTQHVQRNESLQEVSVRGMQHLDMAEAVDKQKG